MAFPYSSHSGTIDPRRIRGCQPCSRPSGCCGAILTTEISSHLENGTFSITALVGPQHNCTLGTVCRRRYQEFMVEQLGDEVRSDARPECGDSQGFSKLRAHHVALTWREPYFHSFLLNLIPTRSATTRRCVSVCKRTWIHRARREDLSCHILLKRSVSMPRIVVGICIILFSTLSQR
jgi:hypothetical protein